MRTKYGLAFECVHVYLPLSIPIRYGCVDMVCASASQSRYTCARVVYTQHTNPSSHQQHIVVVVVLVVVHNVSLNRIHVCTLLASHIYLCDCDGTQCIVQQASGFSPFVVYANCWRFVTNILSESGYRPEESSSKRHIFKAAPRVRALGQNATKTKHYTNTMCNTSKRGESALVWEGGVGEGWEVWRYTRCDGGGWLRSFIAVERNECGTDRLNRGISIRRPNRFGAITPRIFDTALDSARHREPRIYGASRSRLTQVFSVNASLWI